NSLKAFVSQYSNIELHINSHQIAHLMNQSFLAIVTPSITMNEVWYMEIPFIAIKVVDNQLYMHQFLKEKNMNVLDSFNENILERYLKKFLWI
ncbi:MAG: UDP-2,4-diacetamido-2,4,6-trideoxy-beta-L-altropyranose hydrolase, partial [Epsilonproteobacteria bacterium]|nr:UDP-2,4-diacetamido-2,4,6-trideoxy-beta-L-altropyranose hydrolase [Campylobacterota bacterium]